MITKAKIKHGPVWISLSVEDAVALRNSGTEEPMICPECRGRVNLYVGGGAVAHFGHNEAHVGCPLSHHFNGKFAVHPAAII